MDYSPCNPFLCLTNNLNTKIYSMTNPCFCQDSRTFHRLQKHTDFLIFRHNFVVHFSARYRMRKGDPVRTQSQLLCRAISVFRISHNRNSRICQLHTNLVMSACMKCNIQQHLLSFLRNNLIITGVLFIIGVTWGLIFQFAGITF